MQVIKVPGQEDKFQVLFNGQVQHCRADVDCRGAAICAVNQTWQIAENQGECMCNTLYGFQGVTCEEFGPHGIAILVIHISEVVLCFTVMVWGAILLTLYVRATWEEKSKQRLCTIYLSIAFSTVGSLLVMVGTILELVFTSGFPSTYALEKEETQELILLKRPPQQMADAAYALLAIGFSCIMFALVLLPLAWIVRTSVRLRKSNIILVTWVSLGLAFIVVAVVLPLYILLVKQQGIVSMAQYGLPLSIVWCFVFAVVTLLNILALFKITRLKQSDMISPGNLLLRATLDRIQISAFVLAALGICLIVFLGVLSTQNLQGYYTDPWPDVDGTDVMVRSGRFLLVLGAGVCVWFARGPVMLAVGNVRRRSLQTGTCDMAGDDLVKPEVDLKGAQAMIITPQITNRTLMEV